MKTKLIFGSLLVFSAAANAQWMLNGNVIGAASFLGSTNARDLRFFTNNTEKMRILVGGNVGINTIGPATRLEVDASNTVDDGITITQSNTGRFGLFLNNTNVVKNWAMLADNSGDLTITDYTSALDRIYISGTNGFVGMGTNSPLAHLHVTGATRGIRGEGNYSGVAGQATGGSGLGPAIGTSGYADGCTTNYGGSFASTDGGIGTTNYGVYAQVLNPTNGGSNYAVFGEAGGTNYGGGGPVWAGYFNGDLVSTTGYWTISDRRLKKEIAQVNNSLGIINKLNPVTYNFDTEAAPGIALSTQKQYGFLSQEVKEILPEFTKTIIHPAKLDENGKEIFPKQEILGLNYNGFIALLTKGMQEQQKMISSQQQQIDELKQLLNASGIQSGTGLGEAGIAPGFSMEQNEPNPFNGQTVIKYNLPASITAASLVICDLGGRQVLSMPLSQKGPGQVSIDSEKLAAGIYIYSIVSGSKVMASKRMAVSEK